MTSLLVVGANGLVGSYLVPLLAGHREVVACGRTADGPAIPNVVRTASDLSQPFDPRILPEAVDTIVYLAHSRRHRDFPEGAADIFQVQVAQPLALLEAALPRGLRHFVYASSGSVYAPSDRPLREEDPAAGSGFYGASKLAAEILLGSYAPLVSVALLRFFFIYGKGQRRDMLLPRLVDAVAGGKPVTLQGEEGFCLSPLHAADAASAIIAALDLDGTHTINVAGPQVLSMRAVCDMAGRALGREPLFEIHRDTHPRHLIADTARMKALFPMPLRRFEDGVADLIP